jgi:hypothetical protein
MSDELKCRLQIAASRVITAKAIVADEAQSMEFLKRRQRDASSELEAAQERYDSICAELVDPLSK